MATARPRAGARISGLAALLFVISTLIVGGLGSAQMWDAGIARTLIPFGRILPVILVAELLAYSALMVGQFGGTLRGRHIRSEERRVG